MTRTYLDELGSGPPPTTTQRVFSLSVFYDGNCPICRKEIAFYETREGSHKIEWVNVHTNSRKLKMADISKCNALARLHVITSDGNISTGVDAFQTIWRTLPNFTFLANLLDVPALRWLSSGLYQYFLKHRSSFQTLVSN